MTIVQSVSIDCCSCFHRIDVFYIEINCYDEHVDSFLIIEGLDRECNNIDIWKVAYFNVTRMVGGKLKWTGSVRRWNVPVI